MRRSGPTHGISSKTPGRGKNSTDSYVSEYNSLPGLGHACGHNLIAMASAGAGAALANVLKPEAGGVQVLGTHAEEGGGEKLSCKQRDIPRT